MRGRLAGLAVLLCGAVWPGAASDSENCTFKHSCVRVLDVARSQVSPRHSSVKRFCFPIASVARIAWSLSDGRCLKGTRMACCYGVAITEIARCMGTVVCDCVILVIACGITFIDLLSNVLCNR